MTMKPVQTLTAREMNASGKTPDLRSKHDRIAVVYLARFAEGITPLQKFIESYVRHPAGIPHELVVVYKGFDKERDLSAAKSLFAPLPHVSLQIMDSGYDVNAYLMAASNLEHDYVCFLNTFSEIASPDWLSILYKYASLPDVGIVGAMGSYESLYDSFGLINKVIWLCNEKRIAYDRQLEYFYSFIIDTHCKLWKVAKGRQLIVSTKIFTLRAKHILSRLRGRSYRSLAKGLASRAKHSLSRMKRHVYRGSLDRRSRVRNSADEEFRRIWGRLAKPGGTMADYSRFPKFPNPHIRSNAFMISRQRFLGLQGRDIQTKLDACAFESGFDSMTNQFRRKGLRPVIVDRFGKDYDVADWVRSGTFRLGNQEGLIVKDNQSLVFDYMTPGAKATHVRMTWGDCLGPPPPDYPDLEYKFAAAPLITDQGYKFSFLIPSKNRLQLLKFAVDSILRQDYTNFEIVISDNASEEDYSGFIDEIRDERIVYQRVSEPVSVTENWNRALSMASGDYVLMLGDDDALVPGCIKRLTELIGARYDPDIIYMAAYHYCYPNVLPHAPQGYLADVSNSVFFKGKKAPFSLPLKQAQTLAWAACDFRYRFGFNSQHFLFRAGFLKKLSAMGGVFQGPYPDTFAAIVSFMKAKSILAVPESMVIIGISPKSFGYFYFNNKQTEGYDFLDNIKVSADVRDRIKDVLLPGDGNNTNWLIAVEAAKEALAPSIKLTTNIKRYRIFQMIAFLRIMYVEGTGNHREIKKIISMLSWPEYMIFKALHVVARIGRVGGRKFLNRVFQMIGRPLEQFCPARITMIDIGDHVNITDALNWLARNRVWDVKVKS